MTPWWRASTITHLSHGLVMKYRLYSYIDICAISRRRNEKKEGHVREGNSYVVDGCHRSRHNDFCLDKKNILGRSSLRSLPRPPLSHDAQLVGHSYSGMLNRHE